MRKTTFATQSRLSGFPYNLQYNTIQILLSTPHGEMETPPIRAKQLSMAATSWVHMRELLARPWVGVCVPLALSLSSS